MAERRQSHTPPSRADGEGLRVIPKTSVARGRVLPWAISLVVVLAVALIGWRLMSEPVRGSDAAVVQTTVGHDAASSAASARLPSERSPRQAGSQEDPQAMPRNDPNDLAAYFQPGDPEPTGAELIEALQQAGVRTGLGAFNPPGTSPPLIGLAVPEEYPLPPGYGRHYQATDDGQRIEPSLMYAPDAVLFDAAGRRIAIPPDRVVPPELAPPGLELRPVRIPPPLDPRSPA